MDEPEPTQAAATDSVRFGHFRVGRRENGSLEELGRGAMGVTYRALDDNLRIPVALKVIASDYVNDEQARRRFQREARAAAQLRHPNIASVVHLGEEGGEFFYAMEFVVGRPLSALLKETPVLSPKLALALMAQVAAALAAAHKRELIHRDLKPSNLMLLEGKDIDHDDERTAAAGDRQIKVIDFGLARSFGQTRLEDSLASLTTASTSFTGTPAYASPEQCAGDRDLDGRSDLYSLGVILWQLLVGKLPFTGTLSQVIGKHQFQAPPYDELARQPAEIVRLLRGLLEKDPDKRLPDKASELRDELDRLRRDLDARPARALPPPLPPMPAPPAPPVSASSTTHGLSASAQLPASELDPGATLAIPTTATERGALLRSESIRLAEPGEVLPPSPPPARDPGTVSARGSDPTATAPTATPPPPTGPAGATDWGAEINKLIALLREVPRKVWAVAFVIFILLWSRGGGDSSAERAAKREAREAKRNSARVTPTPTPTPTPVPTSTPALPLPALPAPPEAPAPPKGP